MSDCSIHSPSKMPSEGSHAGNSPEALRNLVVCIDGTSNKFGRRNTNVVKLYKQIDLDTERDPNLEQHAYYSSGIGTHAKNLPFLNRVEKVISDSFDMALAWNVEENVKDAYGWLAGKYRKGDNIYLFGFSRGAYQVRVLASLIHEVGLIRTPTEKQIEMAFGHYRSIHPHKPETREMAAEFKKTYCWPDVRIHFVGVWCDRDTVSSVGLIKGDVFVSTSASVTNAKHFRHALALDERRVKFMPEYFREMNTLSKNMLRPHASSDVKECWFSGCHADVGGVSRLGQPHHAGNISLSWMRREAADQRLKFKSSDPSWNVEDVRSGRTASLKFGWMLLEIMFPFRHQISFSGAGRNMLRWHWFRPRRIIPGQLIHESAWHCGMYRPCATLGRGISIPAVLAGSFNGTEVDEPPETPAPADTVMMDSEELQAWIHRYAGQNELGAMIRPGVDNSTNRVGWLNYIEQQADFDRFVAIAMYILTRTEDEMGVASLANRAKECLEPIFESSVGEHPDLVRVLSLLRYLKKNRDLRKIIVQDFMASALVRLLDFSLSSKNTTGDTLNLVVESICLLLEAEEAELRNTMTRELTRSGLDTLSRMLGTHEPSLTVASLRIIIFLGGDRDEYMGEVRLRLKDKVERLAKKKSGLVGLMAVAAFEGLREGDHTRNLKFSNILAYFGSGVWLDVEGGMKASSLRNCDEKPPLATDNSRIEEQIGLKIKSAISSCNTSERTTATLTLLKLCRYNGVRDQLLDKAIVETFKAQLKRKESSLLAAYTLKTCLQYEMWGAEDLVENVINSEDLAPSIITMLDEGLFDGSVGLVEGFDIFYQLIEYGSLKQVVKENERTMAMLQKKLEGNGHDAIRTSLRCLDILEQPGDAANHSDSTSLVKELVEHSLKHLKNGPWKLQKKGVHILSALSQIAAGQEAIRERVNEIIGLLLPEHYWKEGLESSENPAPSNDTIPTSRRDVKIKPIPPSQMLGATYALYSLSRNEELCNEIRNSKRYATLKGRYYSGSLVTGPDTPPWHYNIPKKIDVLVMMARLIKTIDKGFLYDGIGSVPETIPMVLQHSFGLGVILNSVTRALKSLPGLAAQLIQGTTTAISRGTNKFRRGTRPVEDTDEAAHAEEPQGQSVPLDIPVTESPQSSPVNDQPSALQLVMRENEPQPINLLRDPAQGTGPSDQGTRTNAPRSAIVITSESDDAGPSFSGNDDGEITEVPREGTVTIAPRPVSSGPTGMTATRTPNPLPGPIEQAIQPIVHQASAAPHSQSPGSITLKDFMACDLPTKKFLNLLSPRARVRIRIGSQTFVSPTVKVGNESAGGRRSRTHWKWYFSQPLPSNDKQIDITIERRFLIGYTCIRHIAPTTVQSIREGGDDYLSALRLLDGSPGKE